MEGGGVVWVEEGGLKGKEYLGPSGGGGVVREELVVGLVWVRCRVWESRIKRRWSGRSVVSGYFGSL